MPEPVQEDEKMMSVFKDKTLTACVSFTQK